jgi:hypothetical protein
MAAHVRDLGGFADERTERRHVAERVATDDRRESRDEIELVWWLDAQHPSSGTHRESRPAKEDDPAESPSDPLKASPDLAGADAPYQQDEEHGSRDGGQQACYARRTLRPGLGHAAII